DTLLQALREPRVRARPLHRQRDRLSGVRGQATQVPLALPRRLGGKDLRVQVDELDTWSQSREGPRLHGQRVAGPVPDPRRAAVHEVDADRHRWWFAPD